MPELVVVSEERVPTLEADEVPVDKSVPELVLADTVFEDSVPLVDDRNPVDELVLAVTVFEDSVPLVDDRNPVDELVLELRLKDTVVFKKGGTLDDTDTVSDGVIDDSSEVPVTGLVACVFHDVEVVPVIPDEETVEPVEDVPEDTEISELVKV